MNKVIFFLFVCSVQMAVAQDILLSAQTAVHRNSNGDPINNIINSNGAKDGIWTYRDVEGRIFYKQFFDNNRLKSSYYSLENGVEGSWIDISNYQKIDLVKSTSLRQKIAALFTDYYDKQLLLLVVQGEIKIFYVGNWTFDQRIKLESSIYQLLDNYTNENTENYYLYVD